MVFGKRFMKVQFVSLRNFIYPVYFASKIVNVSWFISNFVVGKIRSKLEPSNQKKRKNAVSFENYDLQLCF